jgi:CPA1 family monovalent cation:H+ antiporter
MRGIVSLAAALALPPDFPFRNLIVLTAFSVVLGTLTIQGLTLGPLLRRLNLRDNDPVGHEFEAARARALSAVLAQFDDDHSPVAAAIREEFLVHLGTSDSTLEDGDSRKSAHIDIRRRAIRAARREVHVMRTTAEIGDDAFHLIEEELDWIEMAEGGREE